MQKGDKVQVDISYGIMVDAVIKETNSGSPLYRNDACILSGFGDPVSLNNIHPLKIKSMIHPKIESLRPLAMRSHAGISFDPKKRGRQVLTDYSNQLWNDLEIIKKHEGDTERYMNKYVSLLSDWLSAKSRCLSTMITGPSNFNTRRNEKANNSEHNKFGYFMEWREKALHAITKPENTDIVKGSENAIEKMTAKLQKLESNQAFMKAINKTLRNKKLSDVEKVETICRDFPAVKESSVLSLLVPDNSGPLGFQSYSLTNNNATINRLKKDIIAENNRLQKYATGNKEYQISGIDVCENVEQNRIQILFDGKPESEMIQKLKSNGFRWSPRNSAWQRQLTTNGIYATKHVLA